MKEILKNKYVLWCIIGLVLAIIFWLLIKSIIKNLKANKDYTQDLEVKTQALSFPLSQYHLWADELFAAMDGMGTDERTIESIIKQLQNKDDWNQLVKAFGQRQSSSWVSKFKGSLITWLQDELGTKDISNLNNHLNTFGVRI